MNMVNPLTMVNMSAKFDKEIRNVLVSIMITSLFQLCPMWPWPLTSKINSIHPLTIVNMCAKFDKEIHNS